MSDITSRPHQPYEVSDVAWWQLSDIERWKLYAHLIRVRVLGARANVKETE